jgi:hypothetical protein
MMAAASQANAQNCALPWPYQVNVVDARGQCVGEIKNVNPTIIARQMGNTIYGIQINAQSGIQKGLALFFYPTPDCSGQAYMEDDSNLPQYLWSDLNGILWTNGAPPNGGTITVQSYRTATTGNCGGFHSGGPMSVGAAIAIDNVLANSLVPPLTVDDPPGVNFRRKLMP